jgi:hypothetical protein
VCALIVRPLYLWERAGIEVQVPDILLVSPWVRVQAVSHAWSCSKEIKEEGQKVWVGMEDKGGKDKRGEKIREGKWLEEEWGEDEKR